MRLAEILSSMRAPSFWVEGFAGAGAECEACFAPGAAARFKRVYLIGCGSSLYAGMYGVQCIERYAALPATALEGNLGSTFNWDMVGGDTLFLGISNTGGSPTVLDTLRRSRKAGACTVAITGERESPIAEACERLLWFAGSHDDVPTKTRSYIQTKMMLLAVALRLGEKRQAQQAFAAEIARIGGLAAAFIDENDKAMQALAEEWKNSFSITAVGSGLHLANTYEASLKVCEMGWMNSAPFEAENYMHGRFRGASPGCPYVLFAPAGAGYAKSLDFLAVAHKKGVPTLVLTDAPNRAVEALAHKVVCLPAGLGEEALAMLSILPVYQLGMYLGVAHGFADPAPRHDGLVAQATSLADLYPGLAADV